MRQARLKHHRAFCRCWMLLAVFIAATIYAIHHDCERRIKRLRKASGRKSGSANERAATAQRELDAARAKETSTLETLGATREELRGERQTIEHDLFFALFDLGLQKCVPRGFLTFVAVQGDYARYENTPRQMGALPRASKVFARA